jgi:hypothetical protein
MPAAPRHGPNASIESNADYAGFQADSKSLEAERSGTKAAHEAAAAAHLKAAVKCFAVKYSDYDWSGKKHEEKAAKHLATARGLGAAAKSTTTPKAKASAPAKAPAAPKTAKLFSGTKRMKGSQQLASYEKNIELGSSGDECIRCGREVKDDAGLMVRIEMAPGWFPVGRDCAEKLAAQGVEVRRGADIHGD